MTAAHTWRFAVAVSAIVALSAPARAPYPGKNIDLIVPYGPGGGFDIYARADAKGDGAPPAEKRARGRAQHPVRRPDQTRKLYTDQRVFLTSYRHLLKE